MSATIVAQDPSIPGDRRDGPPLLAQVRIPAEHVEPGPRGARFHVVDYDSSSGRLGRPAITANERRDPFAGRPDLDVRDPAFIAQNVYAIAARTLATFESALGRRLRWRFDSHQLYLVPRAMPEANAFYAPENHGIFFGYVPGARPVLTALSYDVIAHETTHAILDGLRPGFMEPGLPDQDAYHEALGDIVALLSVFSLPEIAHRLMADGPAKRLTAEQLTPAVLGRTALFALGDELGKAQHGGDTRGGGLRRSVDLAQSADWQRAASFVEPHRRGEILVAAVMQTLLRMWTERLAQPLEVLGAVDRERVAEEGVKAADHLLRMFVRGIDYLPPVELEFDDVLEAVLRADEVVAADDGKHRYRDAVRETFAAFGIRPARRIADVTQTSPQPVYERVNYTVLRSDRDEVLRFVWENAGALREGRAPGVDRRWHTQVQHVRPSVRVGPDGLIVSEVVADYVQSVQMTAGELARQRGGRIPAGLPPATQVELWGGGVIVFDQFGRAKLHQSKRLDDWDRQSRRLAYLVARGLQDADGNYGFTVGSPRGQRFAALHANGDASGEGW